MTMTQTSDVTSWDSFLGEPRGYRRRISYRRMSIVSVVALVVIVLAPVVLSNTNLQIVNVALILALPAMALTVLMGWTGQVSIGSAALLGVSGFAAGDLVVKTHMPFLVVLLIAAAISGIVGLVFGLPTLRLSGIYLAISTLSLQEIFSYVGLRFETSQVGTGGGFLLETPNIGSFQIDTQYRWYGMMVIIAGLVLLGFVYLRGTQTVRLWIAIRDQDRLAAIWGINVGRQKLAVFVLTSVITGFGGALYAYYEGVAQVDTYSLTFAIQIIAMVIIGGMGSVLGAVFGSIVITALPTIVNNILKVVAPNSSDIQNNAAQIGSAVYGFLIMVVIAYRNQDALRAAFSKLTGSLTKRAGPGSKTPQNVPSVPEKSG